MTKKEEYLQDMQSWPTLEPFGKIKKIFKEELPIFIYETGEVNPISLVMIHGLGDEADTWRHIIHPLGKDFHIIAVDLPGFGRSELPESKITPVFLLNFLSELLQVTKVNKAVLIGNSLGGILAHAFAIKQPNQIKGLVLVGGAFLQLEPMGDFGLRLMQIPLLGEWLYTRLRKDPQGAYDSLRNVYHNLDQMPKSDRDFLFTRVNKRVWSDTQRKAYFSTLRNLYSWVRDSQMDILDKLENFHIPTLVIRGEHDSLFPKKNAKGVANIQPNAELREIESAGHLPHQETPDVFLEVLRQWLEKIAV